MSPSTYCEQCGTPAGNGRFCERCGASLSPSDAPPPPPSEAPTAFTEVAEAPTQLTEVAAAPTEVKDAPGLTIAFLDVHGFTAREEDMGIRLVGVPRGSGLVGLSLRASESVRRTVAGPVRLILPTKTGDPEVAVEGIGMVTFTDRRVFGVLSGGQAGDGRTKFKLRATGDGTVALFSIDRGMFRELDVQRTRRGKERGVGLIGDSVAMTIEGFAVMAADRSFGKSGAVTALLAEARSFVGGSQAPPVVHRTTSKTGPPASPTGGRSSAKGLVALAVVAALAAGGAGAYWLTSGEDAEKPAARAVKARAGEPAVDDLPAIPQDETAPDEAPPEEAPPPASFESGRYVQLASFALRENADAEAARLSAAGIDAQVLASDGLRELLPGFQVVVSGPLFSTAAEKRTVRLARKAGTAGTFARALTVVETRADPSALGGQYYGVLDQRSTADVSKRRSISVDIAFESGGTTGTISYGKPACEGQLELVPGDVPVLQYEERITSGKCPAGGRWLMKPNGSDVGATWRSSGRPRYISGHLAP